MTLRRAIASARLLVRRACDIIRPAMDAMCDPEVCYSVTGFLLGMWILFGGAISSVNPSALP